MALKKYLNTLDDLSDGLKEYYVPVSDSDTSKGFQLDVDGDDKSRVNEFRTHNISLLQKNEALKAQIAKFDGIDPNKHRKALEALEKMEGEEERKLVADGNIDELVNRRTSTAIGNMQQQLEAQTTAYKDLEGRKNTLQRSFEQSQVRDAVTAAIEKTGTKVRAGAMSDVLNRTHDIFKMNDEGNMVASSSAGPLFGSTGQPLTIDDHVNQLTKDAGHLFEMTGGGGAEGQRKVGNDRGKKQISLDSPLEIGRRLEELESGKAVLTR